MGLSTWFLRRICHTEGFMPHGFLDHFTLGPCLLLSFLREVELSRPMPHLFVMSPLRICCDTLCSLIEQVETMWKSAIFDRASGHLHSGSGPAMRRLPGRSGVHLHQWLIKEIQHTLVGCLGIKSDSETSPDCATRIAQLFGRIAQLGLRNLDCATPRIAQLCLRNS